MLPDTYTWYNINYQKTYYDINLIQVFKGQSIHLEILFYFRILGILN